MAKHGLGDPANAYAHAMGWFRDRLYVGFTRYVYYGLRPYDLGKVFEVFPVNVPDPIRRIQLTSQGQAQIWRFDPKEATWENVHISPMCMGSQGFEVARHIGFRNMMVFKGPSDTHPALYATSWGSHMGMGPFVLRCSDGKNFEEVAASDRRYFGTQTLRVLAEFRGRLYTIPTGRDSGRDGSHSFQAGVVLECADPAVGGWRPVSEPFFNDSGNFMLFEMAAFNGFLYVGTGNPYEGFQLWKTDAEGNPPYRWKQVLSHGGFRGKLNEGVASLCAFKDHLYIGTGILGGGFDRINDVGPGAPELIRLNKDDTWDLIMGEPRKTPHGLKVPLSGFGAGFNNPFAGYLWRMCAHDGWLYAGTLVWSPWVPFSRQDRLPGKLKSMIDSISIETFMQHFGGFDLWRTRDGMQWRLVTSNGFDNRYNCGVRTMVSTPYGLFLGTANQFGPEVAVKRSDGWKYEPNPVSGAEVWLGTHRPIGKAITIVPLNTEPIASVKGRPVAAAAPGLENPLSEFYGHSLWRHAGYWRDTIRTAEAACENLMDELLAFVRPTAVLRTPRAPTPEEVKEWNDRRSRGLGPTVVKSPFADKWVLDVGCGFGATTGYLLRHFAPDRVVGITDNKDGYRFCKKNLPGAAFHYMNLPKLKFDRDSFDVVICVEEPYRYGNRKKLFREIHRVLKPGGQLLCTDLIFGGTKKNGVKSAADYRELLNGAGMASVRVEDITRHTIEPLLRHGQAFVQRKQMAREIDSETAKAVLSSLPGYTNMVAHYFIVSARKGAQTAPPSKERTG